MEIHAVVTDEPRATFGLRLIPLNEQSQTIQFTSAADELRLNDKSVPFYRDGTWDLDLRLFLDRSVIEVFINKRVSLTLVLQPEICIYRVEFFAENAIVMLRQIEAWEMAQPGYASGDPPAAQDRCR